MIAVAVIFISPIFRQVENFGVLDWDANLFIQAVPRVTVLEYGQLPLWNPYEWGGIPMLASPWSRWLSPSFLLVLAFGTVLGAKLDVLMHLALGLLGTYVLARAYAMTRTAAFLSACAYLCSGWFSLVVASGMSVFLGTALFPWAFYARLRARDDARFIVVLAVVCVLVFFDGAAEPLAILFVALAIHELVGVAIRRTGVRRALVVTVAAAATFAGLAAIKLLPAIELLSQSPRFPRKVGGYSVESLWLSLVERGQSLHTEFPAGQGFWRGASWGIDETGTYVGVAMLVLAGIGIAIAIRVRQHLVLVASLVFFVWMAFGDRAWVGPWKLLHALPPFSLMRVPERFRFVFLLDLALLAGLGLDALRDGLTRLRTVALSKRATAGVAVVAAGAVVLDLVLANSVALRDAFSIPPIVHPASDRFVQIRRLPPYDERGFLESGEEPSALAPSSALYPAVVAGLGTARGFEPLTRRGALRVRVQTEQDYRGEQWLEGAAGSVHLVRWTPNVLVFDVVAESAGVLVINQAFDRGWRSSQGPAPVSESGLLAVPVSQGAGRIELTYRPTSFIVGANVSVVSLLGIAGWLARRRRHPAPARAPVNDRGAP